MTGEVLLPAGTEIDEQAVQRIEDAGIETRAHSLGVDLSQSAGRLRHVLRSRPGSGQAGANR